jgi:hypothetical protein
VSDGRKRDLLALSISPSKVSVVGTLTVPRSFGVYRVTGARREGRLYRFGNHPIRQQELISQYGGASLEALFTERKLAEELASLLNTGRG